MSSRRPGWVGVQPSTSRVLTLEAERSVAKKNPTNPKCALTSASGTDLTGRFSDAPTASANSSYTATADLKGPVPTFASLKRTPDGQDYEQRCDD